MDITIKEKIIFPIQKKIILKGYKEYEDLPEDVSIHVYSLAEIAVEKLLALSDKARNEPRDLYDIWHLISNKYIKLTELIDAFEQKLNFKGNKFADIRGEFLRKESRLRKLWEIRLSFQMPVIPKFDHVFREVHRALRQTKL